MKLKPGDVAEHHVGGELVVIRVRLRNGCPVWWVEHKKLMYLIHEANMTRIGVLRCLKS